MRSERQHHDAVRRKLLDQRLRHRLGGGRDDDAIERRAVGSARQAIAETHLDVLVAERLQPRPGGVRQRAIALDA